jgi:hypothetical protein
MTAFRDRSESETGSNSTTPTGTSVRNSISLPWEFRPFQLIRQNMEWNSAVARDFLETVSYFRTQLPHPPVLECVMENRTANESEKGGLEKGAAGDIGEKQRYHKELEMPLLFASRGRRFLMYYRR